MRKNGAMGIGCLSFGIIGIVFWYGIAMIFIDMRVWAGCIAGLLASALCVYPNKPHLSDGSWYKKAISAYIVGVAVALFVNHLMNLETLLLVVSSVVMLLIVPAVIALIAEVLDD